MLIRKREVEPTKETSCLHPRSQQLYVSKKAKREGKDIMKFGSAVAASATTTTTTTTTKTQSKSLSEATYDSIRKHYPSGSDKDKENALTIQDVDEVYFASMYAFHSETTSAMHILDASGMEASS